MNCPVSREVAYQRLTRKRRAILIELWQLKNDMEWCNENRGMNEDVGEIDRMIQMILETIPKKPGKAEKR